MDLTCEAADQGSNPRRRSIKEMEGPADPHPGVHPAPSPVTVLELYCLQQGPEEALHRYIWRFRGIIDRIPPADLQDISVIAVFHANVRNPMMREKLRAHAMSTLDGLWKMADQCAWAEEAAALPPRGVC